MAVPVAVPALVFVVVSLDLVPKGDACSLQRAHLLATPAVSVSNSY